MQIFSGSDGLVRSSPPSRWAGGNREETELFEERKGKGGEGEEERRGLSSKRGEGEEVEPERDLASPDLISRVQSRPPRQSRRSPGEH